MLDKTINFNYALQLSVLIFAGLCCRWWGRIAQALWNWWSLAQLHRWRYTLETQHPSPARSSLLMNVESSIFSKGSKGFPFHLSILHHGLSFLFYLEDVFTCLGPTQATSLSSWWWNQVYTGWEVSVQIGCSLWGSISLVFPEQTHPLVTFKVIDKKLRICHIQHEQFCQF